jgi:hypothetical protein
MLRTTVLVIAGVLTALGAALVLAGVVLPGIQALVLGGLVLVGTLFERRYRRRKQIPPDDRWQATGERFADPTTGKDVEVFYDPHSGERHYVER